MRGLTRLRLPPSASWVLRIGVASLALACHTPPEPPAPAPLQTLDQLPERQRELLLAWRNRSPSYPALREAAREEPALLSFLVDNLMLDLLRAWHRGRFTFDEVGGYHEVRTELVRLGAPSAPALAALLGVGNGYGPAIAEDVLPLLGEAAVSALLDETNVDRPPLVQAQAMDVLEALPFLGPRPMDVLTVLQERLAQSEHWVVRERAARTIGSLAPRSSLSEEERLALVRSLSLALADTDRAVSNTAALSLALVRDLRAVPALVNHLERLQRGDDLAAARAVQRALEELTGVRGLRTAAAWRGWLRSDSSR